MLYTIIEDCSPYYIRFTWNGLDELINVISSSQAILYKEENGYKHLNYSFVDAIKIIDKIPLKNNINFRLERVAIFETPPGGGCGIHKDGIDNRVSINIPIEILDENCITSWYSDDISVTNPTQANTYTRNIFENYKNLDQFKSLKTMIAKPNEAVLFNTDIFHAWDNTLSTNYRKILTLRSLNQGEIYFEDVKKLLYR
jgi:hypothetical protein